MTPTHVEAIQAIKLQLIACIADRRIDATSGIAIVKKASELAKNVVGMSTQQRKDLMFDLLQDIAAGADGTIGTADDLIPPHVMHAIKTLLELDVASEVFQHTPTHLKTFLKDLVHLLACKK